MSTEADTKVHAEPRENFGKGYARRLRAAGQIPAVIYGHGTEPVHIALPGHQISLIVRRANALLELDVAGTEHLALVKDIQRDPVRQIIEHIDLLVVKKGERLEIDVPIVVVGETAPGTIANQDSNSVTLLVEATNIPEHVEVSVEELEEGARIVASELTLPRGASLVTDPEQLIVGVAVPSATLAELDEIEEADEALAEEQSEESDEDEAEGSSADEAE